METCWHGRSDICPICVLISESHLKAVKQRKLSNGKVKHELESPRYRKIESSGIPTEAAEKNIKQDN
jgi:hypothetical protein